MRNHPSLEIRLLVEASTEHLVASHVPVCAGLRREECAHLGEERREEGVRGVGIDLKGLYIAVVDVANVPERAGYDLRVPIAPARVRRNL